MKELSVKGYYLPDQLLAEVSGFSYSVHEFPELDTTVRVAFPLVTPRFWRRLSLF